MSSEKWRLEEILNKIEEKFINGEISEESYKELKEKYQSKLNDLEQRKISLSAKEEMSSSQKDDYGQELGFLGFFIGGFIGYLNRPSSPLLGQLPFETVITRGENLKGFDELLKPLAHISFNYLITGAILGIVVGWVVGAVGQN